MYKTIFLLLFMLPLFVAAKDNLIVNGKFLPGLTAYPAAWRFYNVRTTGYLESCKKGGPENGNFLRINGEFRVNQKNITLISGETYHLSAWIRCKQQTSGKSGIFFTGYAKPVLPFPENQMQWRFVERVWKFKNGANGRKVPVNIAVNGAGGQLDIAELKLVPLTPGAKIASGNMYESSRPALIPCFPLGYVSLKNPVVEFSLEGRLPGNGRAAFCRLKLEKAKKEYRVKFTDRHIKTVLRGVKAGKDHLLLTVSDAAGKVLFTEKYPIFVRDIPSLPAGAHKLNNFTTELPLIKLEHAGSQGQIINPREGWLYLHFRGSDDFSLTLDGKKVLDSKMLRHETFLRLEPGKYTVAATKGSGVLTVRLITETFLFPVQHSAISNEIITPDFLKEHHLSALTTINCGGDPVFFRSQGRQYLTNFSVVDLRKGKMTEDIMLDRLNKATDVFTGDKFDGTTLDELDYAFATHTFEKFSTVIRRFTNPEKKLLYTYTCGPVNASYREFFSSAVNASGSRGKILHECYERMKPGEQAMQHHLEQMTANMVHYKAEMPRLFGNVAMIFDLSSELPQRSLAHYPDQDFKYHLDMLVHRAATDPALSGLGGVGFWGAHRAGGELQRWAMRLLRHYVIEGKATMLSAEYGYKFFPGHVKNPDFAENLTHWQANSQVKADTFAGYGTKSQLRSQAFSGVGDSFAVFTRTEKNYGELRQKLTGFTPGKTYSLVYLTCDREIMEKNTFIPREYKIGFRLDGAKIIRNTLFADVRFAKGKRITSGKRACVNQRFVVFVANQREIELTFDNKDAKPGEKTALNYIAVRPYYTGR